MAVAPVNSKMFWTIPRHPFNNLFSRTTWLSGHQKG